MKPALILIASLSAASCGTVADPKNDTKKQHKAANPKATVVVDLNQVIGEKNDWYFGGNNIYPNGAQGLLNSNGEFDQKTVDASDAIGLRSYRFPGGSEGNLYKWKRAIGPLNQRVDNVSGNNRGPQSNEFGSDEFGRLLETTGFKNGIIMVAWGYETPEDAADWVEYMNSKVGANPNGGVDWAAVRAANGHPEPYGITNWEIGNEVYGNWELNWGSYPHEGDAARGSGNVPEDQRKGKKGTLPFGNAKRYVFGGSKYFKQQKAATESSWREEHVKTTGNAGQRFFTKFAPVNLDNNDKPFVVIIDGTTWERVKNFTHSSATDRHYTLNTKTGEIRFGDGIKGAIPQAGQFVMLDYLTGRQPGFVDYYQAMKAVDPSINVISCFEKDSFYKHMATAKQPFDGVVKHYYPRTIKDAPKNSQYAASIVAGQSINTPIEKHLSWMKKYPNPALTGHEKLWLTEYTIPNHIMQASVMHRVINDYSDTVASMLGHSLYLDNNTPMITDKGVVRSKGLPVFLFSKLSQPYYVKTQVQTGHRQYKEQKFPKLLATSSANKERDKATIVLTNTNGGKKIDATISLKGMVEAKQFTVSSWLLNSNTQKVLDDNTDEKPENISIKSGGTFSTTEKALAITIPAGTILTLVVEAINPDQPSLSHSS